MDQCVSFRVYTVGARARKSRLRESLARKSRKKATDKAASRFAQSLPRQMVHGRSEKGNRSCGRGARGRSQRPVARRGRVRTELPGSCAKPQLKTIARMDSHHTGAHQGPCRPSAAHIVSVQFTREAPPYFPASLNCVGCASGSLPNSEKWDS